MSLEPTHAPSGLGEHLGSARGSSEGVIGSDMIGSPGSSPQKSVVGGSLISRVPCHPRCRPSRQTSEVFCYCKGPYDGGLMIQCD